LKRITQVVQYIYYIVPNSICGSVGVTGSWK